MSAAHQFREAKATAPPSEKKTVLVTGAAGNIGSHFCRHHADRYHLRMLDLDERVAELQSCGETIQCDLADATQLQRHLAGVETVLHLAGDPLPTAPWDSLLPSNIIGTYNLMTSALAAGCRKVIYASSIHAVSGYASDVQVKTSEPVNPGDLYGVSKCFGEALGRFLAEQEKLAVIAIRIGAYQSKSSIARDDHAGHWSLWVSPRDLDQLFVRCIDDDKLTYAIFHGISDSRFKRLDISDARELVGYDPLDDFTDLRPDLRKLDLEEPGRTNPLPKD